MTKTQKIMVNALLTIALSLIIIVLSVKITLIFKPLYYYDINHLNIESNSNLSRAEIVKNYDYLIKFTSSLKHTDFNLPSIISSEDGKMHFQQVRDIFIKLDVLLVLSILLIVVTLYCTRKNKIYAFFKWSAVTLTAISLFFITIFSINFDKSFTLFHKLFFRNGYWEFDPSFDPVINILPEKFFFHCAIMIQSLILAACIILILLYRKKKVSSN